MTGRVQHNFWRRRWLFGLALAGAVISLSNVFSFPLAVSRGGGPFIVTYMVTHVLLALPIIMAELLIGRRARLSMPYGLAVLAAESMVTQRWRYLGVAIVVTGLLVAAYFLVFSSWAADFLANVWQSPIPANAVDARRPIAELLADFPRLTLGFSLVCAVVWTALALPSHWGVQVPLAFMALLLLLGVVVLTIWGMATGSLWVGWARVFGNPGPVNVEAIMEAVAQSFYSLGLGLGLVLVVGMHMDERISIGGTAVWVVCIDLVWSVLFAMVVLGVLPEGWSGDELSLVFSAVPLAVQGVSEPRIWLAVFYVLVLLGGVSTAILLVKHAVMWLSERYGRSRPGAALIAVAVVWIVGMLVILSLTRWRAIRFYNWSILEWVSTVPTDLMIPALGLALVGFLGWQYPELLSREAIASRSEPRYQSWRLSIKFVTTAALLTLLITQINSVWQLAWPLQLLAALMVLSAWAFRRPRLQG